MWRSLCSRWVALVREALFRWLKCVGGGCEGGCYWATVATVVAQVSVMIVMGALGPYALGVKSGVCVTPDLCHAGVSEKVFWKRSMCSAESRKLCRLVVNSVGTVLASMRVMSGSCRGLCFVVASWSVHTPTMLVGVYVGGHVW